MLGWLKRLLRKKTTTPVICNTQDVRMIFIYPENPIDRLSPYEVHLQQEQQQRSSQIKEQYAAWIENCKAVNEMLNKQNTPHKHLRLVA